MTVKLKTACIQSEYLIQAIVHIVQAMIKLFKVWQSSNIYVELQLHTVKSADLQNISCFSTSIITIF